MINPLFRFWITTALPSCFFMTMGILATPYNLHTTYRLLKIFSKKQPLFLLFAAATAGCLPELALAIIESVGFWTTIPFCQVMGNIKIFSFMFKSFTVAIICTCRAVAVALPLFYRRVMKKKHVIFLACIPVAISILSVIVLQVLEQIKFMDMDSYLYVGCTPVIPDKSFGNYLLLVGLFIIVCDMILLLSYIVLHKTLYRKTIRTSLNTLKKQALKITIIIVLSYIICHGPIVIIYLILSFDGALEKMIGIPMLAFAVDCSAGLFAYAHASILALIIVSTNSLQGTKQACVLVISRRY